MDHGTTARWARFKEQIAQDREDACQSMLLIPRPNR